jgi:hypothetical protein
VSPESTTNLEGELKLILHRLEQLGKDQHSGFSELKSRIAHIEESQQRMAVFQGRTEQRLETLENSSQTSVEGMTTMAKMALGIVSTSLGVIATLIAQSL